MKFLFVVTDNGNYIHYFPLGVAYLASVLRQAGHHVTVLNQDVNHYTEEQITLVLDKAEFDFVGVGTIAGYYPYRKLIKVSEAINKSVNRGKFKYVLGGHMPSAEPEFFLKKMKADIAIFGEAEETIVEVVNGEQWNKIKGIAYRIDEECFKNEPRPLIQNLDSVPMPAYDLFPMSVYRLQRFPNIHQDEFSASVISGRGCSFNCTFCYKISEGIRLRNPLAVIEEIKFLKNRYGITYIDFADDLTMSSTKHAQIFCEAFIKSGINIRWRCEGRLNYVKKEVLELMKEAGCVFVNYGIESLDATVLKNIRKGLNKDMIVKGIETTLEVGISPGLNFMWGNIGDTVQTLNEEVDFLIKYDDGAQIRTIRPVTPYPGCELYNYGKEKGLIKDAEDFYENQHVNSDLVAVNFTDMPVDVMHKALYDANVRLLDNYYQKRSIGARESLQNLYLKGDTTFRGFRHL